VTAVPPPTFGATGFTAPAESAILAGVQADFNAAFSATLNFTNPSTPQSQLATSMAAIIGNTYNTFGFLAQQFDPAYAVGRNQDALGRIYFITRIPGAATVVTCTVSGLPGTVIPVGALAQDTAGNIYSCTAQVQIGISGSASTTFANQVTGPIACPPGTLTTIYQAVGGWSAVTNPLAGVTGTNVESRYSFESRRQASVATNAVGIVPAVRGAVLAVPGVLDAYVTENVSSTPQTVGGVTLPANSLYVAATGGTAAAVAQAIWSKKSPGCNYYTGAGSTSVVVQDTQSGYSPPYPSYTVSFVVPAPLAILFGVSITNSPQVPTNAVAQVQAAIASAFTGQDGGPPAQIGSVIYASRFTPPVAALGTWARILTIGVGSANTPAATVTARIDSGTPGTAGTVLTVSAVSSGTVGSGQFVIAAGVAAGIQIVSAGTGTGGTGTYNLNVPQSIASEAMTLAATNQNLVTVNINQEPTFNASNVVVAIV
jgi:uncharacterized phage protein gp47/JayE